MSKEDGEQQPQSKEHWASLADRLNPNRSAFDPTLKAKWKSMSKIERQKLLREDEDKIRALKARGRTELPFEAEDDDHCETSPTAYAHIAPLLELLARKLHKKKPAKHLKIYDPYYCAGGTVQHLQGLGFPQVYNQPEDFYQIIADHKIPPHDVIVTNPPYSGDHFDRLLEFLQQSHRPFFLLLPSHFSKRPAYQDFVKAMSQDNNDDGLVFVTPPERYHYWTPEGRRSATKKDDNSKQSSKKRKRTQAHHNLHLGSRNSPFCSHWFVSLAPVISKQEVLALDAKMKQVDGGSVGILPKGCTLHGDPVTLEGSQQAFRGSSGDLAKNEESSSNRKKKKKKKKKELSKEKAEQA